MPNQNPNLSELNRPIWSVIGYSKSRALIKMTGKTYIDAFSIADRLTITTGHAATIITDKAAQRIK